jgi:protein tyrosine phosphatase
MESISIPKNTSDLSAAEHTVPQSEEEYIFWRWDKSSTTCNQNPTQSTTYIMHQPLHSTEVMDLNLTPLQPLQPLQPMPLFKPIPHPLQGSALCQNQTLDDETAPYILSGKFIVENSYSEWINILTSKGIRDPFDYINKKSNEVVGGFYDDIVSALDYKLISQLRRYSDRFLRTNSMVTIDHEMKPVDFVDVSRIGPRFFSSSAPIDIGFRNFFKFVYENVNVILMVTSLMENQRKKADQYVFPDPHDQYAGTYRYYGEFGIKSEIVETDSVNIIVTKVLIKKLSSIKSDRVVYHIHFTGWTDHHVPNCNEFCSVINIYEKYMAMQSGSDCYKPLIHCSAGIGRAGTWIAIQYLIEMLESPDPKRSVWETKINLVDMVLMLRDYCAGMIQTLVQFQFVYNHIRQHIIKRITVEQK